MKRIEVIIDGKSLPCYVTGGAFLRFRDRTGREASQVRTDEISAMVTLLGCCVASASRREKVEFDMDLLDFADSIDQEQIAEWSKVISEDSEGEDDSGEEKKS